MTDLHALIADLPKAELHLHIEGSLEPEMLFALAQRNGVDIPFGSVEDVRSAYHFSNLQDFLDIYYQGMSVLRTEQDFHDLTDAYLARARADKVRHVEIFFDPQGHTERGLDFSVPVEGILAALDAAPARHGVSAQLIMCFLRHLSEEDAFDTLQQAEPWADRIAGVGLDSSEVGHPPEKFARVFARAGEMGLRRVAHAGEEGPPEYVWQALDLLKVDRIDHGNRSLEDPQLVDRLVEQDMPLTVCPLSNLALCVIDQLEDHPLKKMLDRGLKATVNSDDPSYFGGYVGKNYADTADAVGLTADNIVTLARNGFRGSFLSEPEKARHLAEIEQVAAAHGLRCLSGKP